MNVFKAGFSETIVNPPLDYPLHGYYLNRKGKGFIDDLKASALALSLNDNNIIIISVDNGGFKQTVIEKFSYAITKRTGIKKENIFITATHSHTAPSTFFPEFYETEKNKIDSYINFLTTKLTNLCIEALNDLKPAKMGYAVGKAPDRIAYIRRYRMKDGSTLTCPTINDPNIVGPIGELDQRVNIIRLDRENTNSIVILNYGIHADTVNGDYYCSDWIGWTRDTIEKALDGTKCMCLIGAQGDVGSTNINPIPGDMNDTEISFDNEMKSPGMARFIGRALAGVILQVYDKVAYVQVDNIKSVQTKLPVKMNIPKKEDLPLAKKYKKLYENEESDKIPYTGMELTTIVAEALRMCKMENDPPIAYLTLSGIRIGNIAFVGIPGEPFTDIGIQIKNSNDYDLILPCAIANGYEGYFPIKSAFDEGGYEARTSPYKPEISESIISCAKEILAKLKK